MIDVRILLSGMTFWLAAVLAAGAGAAEQNLPELGDHSSGIVSLEQERKLGQHFLRSVLAQVPTVEDALLKDYVEGPNY